MILSISASFSSQNSKSFAPADRLQSREFVLKSPIFSRKAPTLEEMFSGRFDGQYADAYFVEGQRFETQPFRAGALAQTHCRITFRNPAPFTIEGGDTILIKDIIDETRSPFNSDLNALTYAVEAGTKAGPVGGRLTCIAGLLTKSLGAKNIVYNLGEELKLVPWWKRIDSHSFYFYFLV